MMKAITYILLCLSFCSCGKLNNRKPISELNFSKLYFASSGCYGTCPVMQIEINSDRQFSFHGILYTDKIGFYKGTLCDSTYRQIINSMKKLTIDNKEKNHLPPPPDIQIYDMIISIKNGVKMNSDTFIFDSDLIDILLESYKKIDLIKVDTLIFDRVPII